MTAFQDLLQAIEARGRVVARRGVMRAGTALLARASTELPGIGAELEGGDLRLVAPGLRARAFGSRRAMPDPRLAGLAR